MTVIHCDFLAHLPIVFITVRNEVEKVMFLRASVCPQGGWGCLPQCMLGYHTPTSREQTPPRADTPQEQTHPPEADTPQSRHPQEKTPPTSRHPTKRRHPQGQTPPRTDTPQEQTPPRADTPKSRHPQRADTHPEEQTYFPKSRNTPSRADTHPREQTPPKSHCYGRYASYWNAFLFL